jgi:hypothetical protein
MIAQHAFESLVEKQLGGRVSVALQLARLRADGWDIETLRELAEEYMTLPIESRCFSVEVADTFPEPTLTFARTLTAGSTAGPADKRAVR